LDRRRIAQPVVRDGFLGQMKGGTRFPVLRAVIIMTTAFWMWPRRLHREGAAVDEQIDVLFHQSDLQRWFEGSLADISEGCATIAFKLGAKRSSSAAQLANSEAGATKRLGRRMPSDC